MQMVFYQSSWKSSDKVSIPISNRSFRYGDGLFESFRFIQHRWIFEEQHWLRLTAGAQALKIKLPKALKDQSLQALMELPKNKAFSCRLSICRSGKGKYTPESNQGNWLLEVQEIKDQLYSIPTTGIQVDIENTAITQNEFSAHKTNNALPYVLAGMRKDELALDDLLLINAFGELVEACYSNVFIVKEQNIFTPPLSSGCLNGTIRKVLLAFKSGELQIQEKVMYPKDVYSADEIWLTNSLSGIRWVKQCGKLKFAGDWAQQYQHKLNELAQHSH